MSAPLALEPEVRPVDRGLPGVGERRDRTPRKPFPETPEREGTERKPLPRTKLDPDVTDGERHIDVRV